MALSSTTLRDELEDALADLTGDGPPDAVHRLCSAWGEYFKGATVSGTPAVASAVNAGVALMETAMDFSEDDTAAGGAAIFTVGLTIFWAHVQANTSTYWPGTLPGTLPGGLGSLTSALTSVFGSNNDPSVTRLQAATAMAGALHTNAGLGGTVTVGITPTPVL